MKEALKLALEALQWSKPHKDAVITHSEAITAINAALAQPAQEPVVFCMHWEDRWGCNHYVDPKEPHPANAKPLYTTPQQRPWVGLMDEDKETLILKHAPPLHPDYKDDSLHGLLQAANDFLRELNT
jgi:hypothetical protein